MEYPLICVAILAKQKESMLPSWLKSLEAWDYPKDRMELYIRTNNNTDQTGVMLRDWIYNNIGKYHGIMSDFSDIDTRYAKMIKIYNKEDIKKIEKLSDFNDPDCTLIISRTQIPRIWIDSIDGLRDALLKDSP